MRAIDQRGLVNLAVAIGYALSDKDQFKEIGRAARRALDIKSPESSPLGEAWRVETKKVASGLLVRVYREVEYDGGHVGTYDMEEGEMFALFRTDGQIVPGDEVSFAAELKE